VGSSLIRYQQIPAPTIHRSRNAQWDENRGCRDTEYTVSMFRDVNLDVPEGNEPSTCLSLLLSSKVQDDDVYHLM
jgi:hypothetical protein